MNPFQDFIVWVLRRPYFLKMNDDQLELIVVLFGLSLVLIGSVGIYYTFLLWGK